MYTSTCSRRYVLNRGHSCKTGIAEVGRDMLTAMNVINEGLELQERQSTPLPLARNALLSVVEHTLLRDCRRDQPGGGRVLVSFVRGVPVHLLRRGHARKVGRRRAHTWGRGCAFVKTTRARHRGRTRTTLFAFADKVRESVSLEWIGLQSVLTVIGFHKICRFVLNFSNLHWQCWRQMHP